jgi:hypothetical protein
MDFFLMTENFDLFGDPVPAGWGRRGRPQHIATQENRNKVQMLLALGWNNERITRALDITPPTLRRNYFRDLKFREERRDQLDAALAMRLWQEVEAGNVSAMKEFRKLLERNDLMLYGQTARPEEAKPAKGQVLGKKAQALLDAREPDTGTTLGELMARRQVN